MNDQNWIEESGARRNARRIAAVVFIAAGLNHFLHEWFYVRMIPPVLPHPWGLVWFSGVCEIAGGIGLLFRPLQRAAVWGLIALLIAVFPANIYMAIQSGQFADLHLPAWTFWLRLPLQFAFIAGIWWLKPKRT